MKTAQLIGPSKARHSLCACDVCGNELPIETSGAQETELKCSWCGVEILVKIDCGYSIVLRKNPGSANEKQAFVKSYLFRIVEAINEKHKMFEAMKNKDICLKEPDLEAAEHWEIVALEHQLNHSRHVKSLMEDKKRIIEILNGWPNDNR